MLEYLRPHLMFFYYQQSDVKVNNHLKNEVTGFGYINVFYNVFSTLSVLITSPFITFILEGFNHPFACLSLYNTGVVAPI